MRVTSSIGRTRRAHGATRCGWLAQSAPTSTGHGDLIREYNLLNRDGEPIRLEPIVPKQTMEAVNRHRNTLRMIARCGGWDMFRVRLNSGL